MSGLTWVGRGGVGTDLIEDSAMLDFMLIRKVILIAVKYKNILHFRLCKS